MKSNNRSRPALPRTAGGLAAGLVLALFTTGPALAQQDRPAPVQVARAEVRELAPSVRATGIVRSRAAADLAAAVGGRLQWVAEPGTVVSAGQLVARLDSRELSLARAEQAARVRRAEVNLVALEREVARLRASGAAVSRFNVDQAQSNRDLAEADLQVARAALAQTDDQLARSRLTAPFDGVVSDRVRRTGEEVARGEVIARIVNPDELEIRLFVPLRHVRAIQPGHVVDVTADRREFTATVSAIVPAGDPRTQSFEVLVKAPPVDGLLAAGNTVQVRLPLGAPQRSLAVPRDALIIRAEGLFIVRVDGEQRAERIPVKAGVADGDWIAVDGTLRAGDRIVVRGGETLRGAEKLDIVGVFEDESRSATAAGGKSRA
jgi:RND family efflux transporter MFP subunit